jgi:hypothetical protein
MLIDPVVCPHVCPHADRRTVPVQMPIGVRWPWLGFSARVDLWNGADPVKPWDWRKAAEPVTTLDE